MKMRQQEHLKNDIVISEIEGKPNVVTLKQYADSILRDFYKSDKESDIVTQKTRLIEAAANLIRHDIKDIVSVKDVSVTLIYHQ